MATEIFILGPDEFTDRIELIESQPLFSHATREELAELLIGSIYGIAKPEDSMHSLRVAITELTGIQAPPGYSVPVYAVNGALNYRTHNDCFEYSALTFKMDAPFITYDTHDAFKVFNDDFDVSADIGSFVIVLDPAKFQDYLYAHPQAYQVVLHDRDRLLITAMSIISVLASPDSALKTLRFLRLHAAQELERSGQSAITGWSHQRIAACLGLSRASIANILSELKDLGVAQTSYQRIDIDIPKINEHILFRSMLSQQSSCS